MSNVFVYFYLLLRFEFDCRDDRCVEFPADFSLLFWLCDCAVDRVDLEFPVELCMLFDPEDERFIELEFFSVLLGIVIRFALFMSLLRFWIPISLVWLLLSWDVLVVLLTVVLVATRLELVLIELLAFLSFCGESADTLLVVETWFPFRFVSERFIVEFELLLEELLDRDAASGR